MTDKPRLIRQSTRTTFHILEHLDDGMAEKDWSRIKIGYNMLKKIYDSEMEMTKDKE